MADLSSILGGPQARPIDIKAEADKWLNKGFDPVGQYAQYGMSPPLRQGDMASIGLDMAPGIGDIKSGIEGIQAMTKGDSLGAVLGGLGALPAVPGFAGIFAGAKAKTADLAKLARAEDMFKAGAPREAIWNETGWWQGPDQQWRFEIPDNEAALTETARKRFTPGIIDFTGDKHSASVADTLSHPDLQKAYPEWMRDVNIAESPKLEGGGFKLSEHILDPNRKVGLIEIAQSGAAPKSTMLHELQHAIQHHEGFATGGAPEMAFRDPRMWGAQGAAGSDTARKMLQAKRQEIQQALPLEEYARQAWGSSEVTPEISTAYTTNYLPTLKKSLSPEIEASLQKTVAQEWYKRLAGEAEARLTQSRMNMTPQERQARPPWTMFDVPESDQIVRR